MKSTFKTIETVVKRTGVNSGETNWQDYYYGDYLLRVGKITQEEYNENMVEALRKFNLIVENPVEEQSEAEKPETKKVTNVAI